MKRGGATSARPPRRPAVDRGIALTPAGSCGAHGCRAPMFAELMRTDAPGLCVDCAPRLVERRARLRGLFERSGGRLPADDGGHTFAR